MTNYTTAYVRPVDVDDLPNGKKECERQGGDDGKKDKERCCDLKPKTGKQRMDVQ